MLGTVPLATSAVEPVAARLGVEREASKGSLVLGWLALTLSRTRVVVGPADPLPWLRTLKLAAKACPACTVVVPKNRFSATRSGVPTTCRFTVNVLVADCPPEVICSVAV